MHKHKDTLRLAPTDLGNFLSCRHLSSLDVRAARGLTTRPVRHGPVLDELKARGLLHEQRYLDHLRAEGLSIAQVAGDDADRGSRAALERTLAAMREGVDVVYQATLADATWSGRADFLLRVDRPGDLGDWSYEVLDTKLAHETRAGTLLQLCVYSWLLGRLQGVQPERMHVVTPKRSFQPLSYRLEDYSAYVRLLEQGMAGFLRTPHETYPELVSHCDLCAWWSECEKRRRADDHLCYVAGIRSNQIKSLRALGIDRLEDLARLREVPEPARGSREALVRIRDQARLQAEGRERGVPCHELVMPFDEGHGLSLLPEPTPDDLFLDFEGNHFAEEGVREYLTGFVSRSSSGARTYTAFWARTLEEERLAFERFIDLAIERRRRNPLSHIYHFAAYEPTALKGLMGRFATREAELDELLRGGAFVDLYAAVRRSLIASVERYSIKDLEPFFGYERVQGLADAAMSRRVVEHAIEAGEVDERIAAHCRIVEDYNREDCESAERLRDWLEALRAGVIAEGHALPRPVPKDGAAAETIGELDRELRRLREGLLLGIPAEPAERTDEQHARFVLAHLMEFHRREDKAGWWEYYRLLELDREDYADERRAIAGLVFGHVVAPMRAPVHRYRFPPQELDARGRDRIYASDGTEIGGVEEVNYAARTIDIKKRVVTAECHPADVVLHNHVDSKTLRESLMRFGEAVLEDGLTGRAPYAAACELLLRRPSPLIGASGELQEPGETTVEAACRLAQVLDGHVLAVQGPPGTGKTYTGARVICALVTAGFRIGVTAVSHKVIENLLEGALREARKENITLRAVHRQRGDYEGEWGLERQHDYETLRTGLEDGSIEVLGATAWCWARADFEQSVDVLIVDEAGQMSLGNVLAAAPAGRGLLLLGDPQQLEQPLQSSHPEGSEASALYHLLAGEETMPPDKGLFLAETWRLHPDIARFTSEAYYEGRVAARPGLERQAIIPGPGRTLRFEGSGLRYLAVAHVGNQAKSLEEAEAIRELVTELLDGASWRDAGGNVSLLTPNDILVVAPYNAQVAALGEALPALRERIGTVDRFQGQEAAVVIYSMTSSSPEDAPRGMDFLYDRHRFNVATSRARAMCILVGNPALFEPECRTPRQMRRANGFCRYRELAQPQ